ncbi:MAG: hypothetical protein A4E69_02174 [Syntrophus sp. PtaB.Bin138]|nr:MAG: hypothetical protein A4E69_02174 [Syntrophus sp. PtaB.Bin138]
MKRRKSSFLSICLIAVAVLLLPGAAMAYQVSFTDGVGDGGGGMFGVWNADTNKYLFDTYCLEKNEFVNFGKHYDFTVDEEAYAGGIGGGSPDPLGFDTAFLYNAFRTDALNLLGMDVTNAGDVTAFQYAIWFLEEEVASIPTTYQGKANSYLALATAAGWTDIGNVRVLNITYQDARQNTVLAQSMLTLLPVPEPSLLILLGLGMFGVGVASRKLKK